MMMNLADLELKIDRICKDLESMSLDIRDSDLESENITRVGKALTYLFEIRDQIYARDPSIKPGHLEVTSIHSKWNKQFTSLLVEVGKLLKNSNKGAAVAKLEQFISGDAPEKYKQLALSEIKRINA